MKKVLTIAGSDCSGGAGIQADLKTMVMHKVYGMSVITALTAQNTLGVSGVMDVPAEFVEAQLDAIFRDITPDAIKIGMISNVEILNSIVKKLVEYRAQNIVVDPVMVSTSGSMLLAESAIGILKQKLISMASLVTPNIPEAEVLSGIEIKNLEDMMIAAEKISKLRVAAVLIKGGHSIEDANDLLYYDGEFNWFKSKRVQNTNTHGTGCTLSSAIASNLALGYNLYESIAQAKAYINKTLEAGLDLGSGSGPLNHAIGIE